MSVTIADPVSIEIHRQALENITTEMAITLTRTSGSPVVYEVQDFATSLLDTDGEQLAMSATITLHAGSSLLGTRAVIESLGGAEPREGDGWIVNDAFSGGAMHQGDVAIIMPTFYAGEHVGWAFTNVHVLDVGGMGVSGFAPGAKTVFDEGVRFPATKILSGGEIDPGWIGYIGANVRIADLVVNDLRAMVAANNVAQRKLGELIDRFGIERHREFSELNKSLTEEAFRKRIAALPDGVFETTSWVEYDGQGADELLEIRCRLEIAGSEMRFGFAGAAQASAFVNGTNGVVHGGVMAVLLVALGYGQLPFNAGMWRPISIDIGEPGTVVNAVPPAPVSCGHAAAGFCVSRVVREVIGQACGLSEDPRLRGRVAAVAPESVGMAPLAGLGHGGLPTVVFLMDVVTGNGGPGQTVGDGQECYGASGSPGIGLPSIETNEAQAPALYLWRRLVPQSGGPGTFRGGQALKLAYSAYDTELLSGAVTVGHTEVPAAGAGGGLPAGAGSWEVYLENNLAALVAAGTQPTREVLDGKTGAERADEGRLDLARDDVITMSGGGGGGLGDPLLRDPELVAADVRDRYVDADHARAVYGVVLAGPDCTVDAEATAAARRAIVEARLGGPPAKELEPPRDVGVAVALDGDEWSCAHCGSGLGPAAENWRGRSRSRQRPLAAAYAEYGMSVRARSEEPPIMLGERFCPGCGALLAAEVYPEGFEGYPAPRLAAAGGAG